MTDKPRDLRPVGRLEWEQILRRARMAGLINGSGNLGEKGNPTKGGVSGSAFKAVAMCLASYGDYDGTRIWPGDAAIAVDLECSFVTVVKVRAKLVELGLLEWVAGARSGRGEEWRLTVPSDLADRVDVLTPATHKLESGRVAERRRGKNRGVDKRIGQTGGPTGHPREAEPVAHRGDPLGTPGATPADSTGGPTGSAQMATGGPTGSHRGDPLGPLTKPLPSHKDDQANSGDDLGTDCHPPRDDISEEPIDVDVVEEIAPPTNLDTRRCPHGNSTRHTRGRPRCPECRTAATTDPDEPAASVPIPEPARPLAPPACTEHPAFTGGTRGDGRPNCTICRLAVSPRRYDVAAYTARPPGTEGHLA